MGLLKGNINSFFNINNSFSCQTFLYQEVATETDRQFWEIEHSSYLLYYARITVSLIRKIAFDKMEKGSRHPLKSEQTTVHGFWAIFLIQNFPIRPKRQVLTVL